MMAYFPLINHYKLEVFALTTLFSLSLRIFHWYMTRPHSCTNSSVKNLFSFRSLFSFETQPKFNEKKHLLCSLALKANKSLQMQKFYRNYLPSVRNNLEMNKKFFHWLIFCRLNLKPLELCYCFMQIVRLQNLAVVLKLLQGGINSVITCIYVMSFFQLV